MQELNSAPPTAQPDGLLGASLALPPVSCKRGASNTSISLCLSFPLCKTEEHGGFHPAAGVLCSLSYCYCLPLCLSTLYQVPEGVATEPLPGSETQMAPRSARLWVGGLQPQAAWRRDGKDPGTGRAPRTVSRHSSNALAPSSWSVSASLCRYTHADGQQRPSRAPIPGPGPGSRRARTPLAASLRPQPDISPRSTPNCPRECDMASLTPPSSHPYALTVPHPRVALPSASPGLPLPSVLRTCLLLQEAFLDFFNATHRTLKCQCWEGLRPPRLFNGGCRGKLRPVQGW